MVAAATSSLSPGSACGAIESKTIERTTVARRFMTYPPPHGKLSQPSVLRSPGRRAASRGHPAPVCHGWQAHVPASWLIQLTAFAQRRSVLRFLHAYEHMVSGGVPGVVNADEEQ